MLQFIAGRLVQMIPVLLGVSLIAFLSVHLVPGDPIEIMTLGRATPETIAAIIAGRFLVPTSRNPEQPRLDLVGAGLSIVGLGALVASIIEAPSNETMAKISVALGARGTIQLMTLPAMTIDEFIKTLKK